MTDAAKANLRPQVLMDYLQIERVPHDDPRRGPYWNLFELWYKARHGNYPPYLYSDNGRIFWNVTPESSRLIAIALVQHGVFDAARLAAYKRDLNAMALDKHLGDDLYVMELAKLNTAFLPHIHHHGEAAHVLLKRTQRMFHRHGDGYCPGCNAAAGSLLKAENGAEVAAALAEMDPTQREAALENIGFTAHIKEFAADSASWLVAGSLPGSLKIDIARLIRA